MRLRTVAACVGLVALVSVSLIQGAEQVPSMLQLTMNRLDGKATPLANYQGKVLLVVNVASQCGYTPQYAGLEQLHEKYAARGLAVLGFPANEFGAQEPGSNAEIADFCQKNYGVKFDVFAKVVVKGPGQCELYKILTSPGADPKLAGDVKWNFEKFLVGRDGRVIGRFASHVEPDDDKLVSAIETALAAKP
ncbi:MAG: glutathione peroxidase [Planctomycetes bacterium]|nr:glutathione peroxidase [Planctomycetota bacterium]